MNKIITREQFESLLNCPASNALACDESWNPLPDAPREECEWVNDEPKNNETTGHSELPYKYCPYCGGLIVEGKGE